MKRWALPLLVALVCAALSSTDERRARADETGPATFALLIGSNLSVDKDLPPLKYADDDAARNLDLFRLLGARTYLLSRLDENTRRLHPQAAAEALEPTRAVLEKTMAQIGSDVAQARDRHLETELYVMYAGHGNVENGEGYVTLEDMRLTGEQLARFLASIPATHIHVITDACDSYYFAYGRGPGGERRPLRGFQDAPRLANDPRIGLLLSTSSARESHEWDAFQAGVFSHEVRSGLYGAADADGDGRVSYREIAAFVARANEAIPNERFRPDVYVKPPAESDTLLDIRRGLSRRLDVDGATGSHYDVEDSRGVRLVDFHTSPGQAVHLVRPPPTGRVYVHELDDGTEVTVPASPDVIALADLQSAPARVASRGAAQDAFGLLFSLPFDRTVVDKFVLTIGASTAPPGPEARDGTDTPVTVPNETLRTLEWSAVAVGAAGLVAGGVLSLSAIETSHHAPAGASQAAIASRDQQISTMNSSAAVSYVAGGVLLASGIGALLFLPQVHVQAAVTPQGAYVGYSRSF